MLFNSYVYILLFLPLVAITFYVAGARLHRELSVAWLVVASFFFYGWWNPFYLLLIIASSVSNFGIGALLSGKKPKKLKLAVLVIGITANLLLLGYYKYANFFLYNVNFAFGTNIDIGETFLPLAISFFTFQQISFLIDTYRGGVKDYSFLHYMLFVTFFPQLIAGPIVHHAEMMPQFDMNETYKPKLRNIEVGLSIFAVGLFKKIVLADTFAAYASPVFRAVDVGTGLSMLEYWLGATAFALQLYFDFSGYSDMAIGSARLFGIKLPINFYSPYKALNVAQLWRRWHMTLTRFATAYIFMPMNIKRGRQALLSDSSESKKFWSSVAYPTTITFLAVGTWHGAGWNFVIWGLIQGVLIVVSNRWHYFRQHTLKQNINESTYAGRIASRFIVMACVTYSIVFFKASTTTAAVTMASGMLGLDGLDLSVALINARSLLIWLLGGFAIIYLLPNTQQLFIDYEPSLEPKRNEKRWGLETLKWAPNWYWAVFSAAIFVSAFINISRASEFIYFQF